MPTYEYIKNYIASHQKYKKWRKEYMTEYMKEYRIKNREHLNARRRELRAIKKKEK